jgi:hypothetical protein
MFLWANCPHGNVVGVNCERKDCGTWNNGVKYLRAMPWYLYQSIYLGFVLLHSISDDEKEWKLCSIQMEILYAIASSNLNLILNSKKELN